MGPGGGGGGGEDDKLPVSSAWNYQRCNKQLIILGPRVNGHMKLSNSVRASFPQSTFFSQTRILNEFSFKVIQYNITQGPIKVVQQMRGRITKTPRISLSAFSSLSHLSSLLVQYESE